MSVAEASVAGPRPGGPRTSCAARPGRRRPAPPREHPSTTSP